MNSDRFKPKTVLVNPIPPKGGSDIIKSCKHKYIFLEQRRVYDKESKSSSMTKLVDVFYCEKCLDYQYKDY